MKTYCCSDLHGQYGLWAQIKEFLGPDDKLFMLGDAADRGEYGWEIIKEALKDPRVVYIRGNHDEMLLDAWKNEWIGDDLYLWMMNGGQPTFDAILADPAADLYLKHLSRSRVYECYENSSAQAIHLSHAGFTMMEGDVIPTREDLLWDRDHIEDSCCWWPLTNPNDYIVHGHTPIMNRRYKLQEGEINESYTVLKYCHGYKIAIDAGSIVSHKCALLDLDTFEEIIFEDKVD